MATYAHVETTIGNFTIELFDTKTPNTVANFVGLAEGTKTWTHPKTGERHTNTPYYDGIVFHRVIKGFMIQGGDPLGLGHGGPGYQFDDEFHPDGFNIGVNDGEAAGQTVMHAHVHVIPRYADDVPDSRAGAGR